MTEPTYDPEDPLLPGETPAPAMTGPNPTEPMGAGAPVQPRTEETAEDIAGRDWKELVALHTNHLPTCAIMIFIDAGPGIRSALTIPRCTCGKE